MSIDQQPNPNPEPQPVVQSGEEFLADFFGLESREGADQGSVGTDEGASGGTTPPLAPEPAPAVGGTPPPQAQPGTPPGQPEAQPPIPAAVDPALRIASLEAEIQALRTTPAPPPPVEGQTAPAAFDPNRPQVLPVQLPPQMLDAVFGDDPAAAAAAINNALSGVATGVAHRLRLEMHSMIGELNTKLAQGQQVVQQKDEAAQAEARRAEYYEKFPHHNTPVILPIIQAATAELSAALPGLGWTDEFRDAVGLKVDSRLRELGVQLPHPGNPTATQGTPAPAPAAMLPTGNRSAPESPDIISETLEFG